MHLIVCNRHGTFISIYTLLLATFFSVLHTGNSECSLSNPADDVSKRVLERLTPLKGKTLEVIVPDKVDKSKSSKFQFKICDQLKTGDDTGAQETKTGEAKPISLGKITSTTASSDKNMMFLSYHNGDDCPNTNSTMKRTSALMLVCDMESDLGSLKYLDPNSECLYTFEVGSKYACTPKEGLSGGSIFCILFFTGISIYLLLGFLYQRLVVGAKGLEQIPNYSFWRDFGNLQADGCDFICRCGPRQEVQSYRGIDERLPRDDERDDQLLNM